jgi:hypothetical protein
VFELILRFIRSIQRILVLAEINRVRPAIVPAAPAAPTAPARVVTERLFEGSTVAVVATRRADPTGHPLGEAP